MGRAYAEAGVDPEKIGPFKAAMARVARETASFSLRREVGVLSDVSNAHGAMWRYIGGWGQPWFVTTEEILGNLNWVAERMYQETGVSYYDRIARAAALIIAVDVIAHGALPFLWLDAVQAGDSDWFLDAVRSADYAAGCIEVGRGIGVTLPAGESRSLRYLVKAEPPVRSAPVLSGAMTGIVPPPRSPIQGGRLPGHRILGAASSGHHANGTSLTIRIAAKLPRGFLTELPNGKSFGEEVLAPMRSYVRLIEALLDAGAPIVEILPGTGDGVAKLAVDRRPYEYRIERWVAELPLVFQFIRDSGAPGGVSSSEWLRECLATYNWGVGLYFFAPADASRRIIEIGADIGYEIYDLGFVAAGERKVIFEPEGIELPPPGA